MKKTVFAKPSYSVAMSEETGCVVMVKTHDGKVQVIGSLTRDDTMKFANQLLVWMPESLRKDFKQIEPPGHEHPEPEGVKLTVVN